MEWAEKGRSGRRRKSAVKYSVKEYGREKQQ
jgi:hypothetical protein